MSELDVNVRICQTIGAAGDSKYMLGVYIGDFVFKRWFPSLSRVMRIKPYPKGLYVRQIIKGFTEHCLKVIQDSKCLE
jgi:hypothetical protein